MDSNYLGRLSGLSDDQITNMLVNDNGNIQLSSELMNQFAITPKLCAKILLDMCDPSKNQETQMMSSQRFDEIDSAANLCREFLPSSPLMNIIQAIDNSSNYLLSKTSSSSSPSSRQLVPPGLYSNDNDVKNSSVHHSISDLNGRIDNLSLNGSMNAFNSHQSRQHQQQFTSSQLPLTTQLNNVSQVGPISTKQNQLQNSLQINHHHQQHQHQQQQQQPQRDYMFDVNNIFPEPQLSISPEIEKEAATYFQRIYNQSTSENLSINEILDMLSRFQSSPNKQERDIFHCMIKNLFKEYCYFPQYPDKELSLTAQLFGGIIQQDLVKFVALVDALTCVLEALRQPFASKMYFFGIAALDQFKSKLKEYPLYCRHLTAIPHFNEFPLTLQEYIQFGTASKDPPSTQFLTVDDVGNSVESTTLHHHHQQQQQQHHHQHNVTTTSHSPVSSSSCHHPNSGSTGLIMNSLMGVNNNMKNDVNLLMPELINNNNQGIIIGNSSGNHHNTISNHIGGIGGNGGGTQELTIGNCGGQAFSPIQSELTNESTVNLINNNNNSLASSPIISRPTINRNGPSTSNTNTNTTNTTISNINTNINTNTNGNLIGNNTNTNNANSNCNNNNVNSASDNNNLTIATPVTVATLSSTTITETIQQTSSEPQNHHASTSDQPCHASSTTTPTSYSDIVKRAIKVVSTTTPPTTTVTNNNNNNNNSNSNNNTTTIITTAPTNNITSSNTNGTKATVIKKSINNMGDNNIMDSIGGIDNPKQNGTIVNGNHESNNSSSGSSANNKKVNTNGCDNQTNGYENYTNDDQSDLTNYSNNYSNNNSCDNNSINSSQCVNGSTTTGNNNTNCNGNLTKLKPTNIWAYNGLRVSNVSSSCSRSTLQSLFNKFGRVKLIERINKTIENSIWVYYDNPSSPVEAAHKLQGIVMEGISVNGSVPLRLYFAPTDDQKDLKFSRPKQPPDNKGECYYWRTTNCFSREQCPLLHIPANKNIDAQIWMGKMNKESTGTSNQPQQQQQQQLINQQQSNSK